ncbi:hypothetical protein [Blattabacterium cuenoti]|uniref:hypothetical protein n=1 Tax=Blattabacterium cuenoti TaxID=1653831 RepID=UPI00163CF6DC|nr:hypothetical protein [Blattabacterium cuenoti]
MKNLTLVTFCHIKTHFLFDKKFILVIDTITSLWHNDWSVKDYMKKCNKNE